MPNWVRNELIVAGPTRAVEAFDAEVWDEELAARPQQDGFRFHRAVPAVAPGTDPWPAYPAGGMGQKAWGCRAVSSAAPHERTVKRGAWCPRNDHPHDFYFILEDTPKSRLVGAGQPMKIRYRFDTAYTPCTKFIDHVGERYPHLYISLSWCGEEPHVHGLKVKGPIEGRWRRYLAAALPPNALLEPLTPMRPAAAAPDDAQRSAIRAKYNAAPKRHAGKRHPLPRTGRSPGTRSPPHPDDAEQLQRDDVGMQPAKFPDQLQELPILVPLGHP